MSFFPRSFLTHPSSHSPFALDNTNTSPSSFHPLFRLLDDFDQYNRASPVTTTHNSHKSNGSHANMRSFTPKFDVKETAEAYELHGELPGIDQKDVEIEFVDAETLTIKGRVERSYTSGTAPLTAGAIESGTTPAATIKDKVHQPSVEDEDTVATTDAGATRSLTTTDGKNEEADLPKSQDTLWISERSVGEFARSFTFPVKVELDSVRASMRNGVLSVVVPKGKKAEGRKIAIE